MTTAVRVIEEWRIIDRWWTAEPDRREFVDVEWWGCRRVILWRREGERVWRIHPESRRLEGPQ